MEMIQESIVELILEIIIFLVLISSRISFESGVLFGFLMSLFVANYSVVFLISSLIVFFVNKTSKMTWFLTYMIFLSFGVYYFNLFLSFSSNK